MQTTHSSGWLRSAKSSRRPHDGKTLDNLNTFPPGLDPLYDRMIQQVYASDEAEICKHILSHATVVYRPITLDGLTSFGKLAGIASRIPHR
jgi:hypothetical protein